MREWKQVNFEEVYLIPSRNGLTRAKAVRGEGYKMVNMGELFRFTRIDNIDMERVGMNDREVANYSLEKGDLLFARQSLVAEGAGKCAIINSIEEVSTFESHLIRVRLDIAKVNPWFYFYYFQSNIGQSKTQSLVNQVAAAGIRGSELAKLKVDCPPKKTQDKIAIILSHYDNLIENNNRRIAILEEMAQRLYREWFVHFRFAGHEGVNMVEFDIGLIPEGWNYSKIRSVLSFSRGKSYKSSEINVDEGLPFINLKNIQSYGGFNSDGTKLFYGAHKKSHQVKNGDVVMAVTDMTQERRLVGRVARVANIKSDYAVMSMDLIKLIPTTEKHLVYIYSLFRYSNLSPQIAEYANGANVLHLNPEVVLQQCFIKPDDNVIDKFIERVEPIYKQIDIVEEKNSVLRQTRDLLLAPLISGDIDVSGLPILTEEV